MLTALAVVLKESVVTYDATKESRVANRRTVEFARSMNPSITSLADLLDVAALSRVPRETRFSSR